MQITRAVEDKSEHDELLSRKHSFLVRKIEESFMEKVSFLWNVSVEILIKQGTCNRLGFEQDLDIDQHGACLGY